MAGRDNEMADEYDELAKKFKWYGNEIIFGLCFDRIRNNMRLLDLGIGTGLGSSLFFGSGLEIHGLDKSQEMLDECRKKGISEDLREYDISKVPYPFEEDHFDFIISIGVLNFFDHLEPFFIESNRLLKVAGTFAFTIVENESDDHEVVEKVDEVWSSSFFKHSRKYIEKLAVENEFILKKDLVFYGLNGKMEPMRNIAFVLEKK
jgi:predicted TPR repeat methyltransferase